MTSLAYGVPAVTTTIGVEGMALRHGEDVLIADASDAFAEAVVALYTDESLWTKLARRGCRAVASQFSVANAEAGLRRTLGISVSAGAGQASLPPQAGRAASVVPSR